jgi:hypothetical protein
MWCKNARCSYGSLTTYMHNNCPQCGGNEFVTKSPFPNKPVRSIRAMDKRLNAEPTGPQFARVRELD